MSLCKLQRPLMLALMFVGLSGSLFAVDGIILIDQNRALAGNVTPGDFPGFPISISQPGSYRLSGNLLVPSGINGIEITASNVTLDLNGFNISSQAQFSFLVKTVGAVRGVTVRNGTISSTAGNMIEFLGASGTVVEDITLLGPNGSGVNLGSVIARRVFFPGSATSIAITCPSVVVDSVAGAFIRSLAVSGCTFGFNSGDVF